MSRRTRRTHPTQRLLLGLCLLCLLCLGALPARATQAQLEAELGALREAQQLPGAAAALWLEGHAQALAVSGQRHLSEPGRPIRHEDRFGIGSITKRLTFLLAARLVDAGRLRWDLTLGEALPDTPMRPEYRAVTLAQLLEFRGGIKAYTRISPPLTPELFDLAGGLAERQARFVRHLLDQAPTAPPGGEAVYSNASYVLAAYVMERVTRQPLAELMQEQVFTPLGLKSGGWGRPRSAAHPEAPWQHLPGPEGYRPEPDEARPPEDLFAAAGGVLLSVSDLARLAWADIEAARGTLALLKPDSARRWASATAPGRARIVAGGAPWLSACYALWPEQGRVLALLVNAGTPRDAACGALVKRVEALATTPQASASTSPSSVAANTLPPASAKLPVTP